MKASLSLLILMTFVLGIALVGNAIAQPSDGGTAIAEPATPAEPAAEPDTAEPAAEEAESIADKPLEQGKALYKNIKGGHWLLAFGFFGMILGTAAKLTIGKKWKFLTSKAGGYTFAGFTGMGALGTLIVEAGAFSVSMLAPALLAMTAAMAAHGVAKDVKKKLKGTSEA